MNGRPSHRGSASAVTGPPRRPSFTKRICGVDGGLFLAVQNLHHRKGTPKRRSGWLQLAPLVSGGSAEKFAAFRTIVLRPEMPRNPGVGRVEEPDIGVGLAVLRPPVGHLPEVEVF